jgi:hypothetical protein
MSGACTIISELIALLAQSHGLVTALLADRSGPAGGFGLPPQGGPLPRDGWYPDTVLAKAYARNRETLRARLREYRTKRPELRGRTWLEVEDRPRNQQQFLYHGASIRAFVESCPAAAPMPPLVQAAGPLVAGERNGNGYHPGIVAAAGPHGGEEGGCPRVRD